MRLLSAPSAILLACAVSLTACGGGAPTAALQAPTDGQTITFWHSWSQPHEVKAIEDNIARFHKSHPTVTVKLRSSITDDDMTKGIDSGASGPDVVTSFSTNLVGEFCSSGRWIDLESLLRKSKISPKRLFPRALMDYTQYGGKRCAMPLLADAFGLYYNKNMFAAAGIAGPPHTLTEMRADAVRLTKHNSDGSLAVAGFMPLFNTYQMGANQLIASWQPQYVDGQGRSNLARDPAVQQMLAWQRGTSDALGGYPALSAFRSTFGDEFSPQNAFEAGKVAMLFDGEWRNANLAEDKVPFDYGTAPFPVPDNMPDTYGGGYVAGTVIGVSKNSAHQAAAWELVRYLTTQTEALTSFAIAIKNVPSTFQSLDAAQQLANDEHFRTFLTTFASPDSGTTPTSGDGGGSRAGFAAVCERWQQGAVKNLTAELAAVDGQIDAASR